MRTFPRSEYTRVSPSGGSGRSLSPTGTSGTSATRRHALPLPPPDRQPAVHPAGDRTGVRAGHGDGDAGPARVGQRRQGRRAVTQRPHDGLLPALGELPARDHDVSAVRGRPPSGTSVRHECSPAPYQRSSGGSTSVPSVVHTDGVGAGAVALPGADEQRAGASGRTPSMRSPAPRPPNVENACGCSADARGGGAPDAPADVAVRAAASCRRRRGSRDRCAASEYQSASAP